VTLFPAAFTSGLAYVLLALLSAVL